MYTAHVIVILLHSQTRTRGAARRPPSRRPGTSSSTPAPSKVTPSGGDDLFGDLSSPPPLSTTTTAKPTTTSVKKAPDLFGNDDLFDDLPTSKVDKPKTVKPSPVLVDDDLFGEQNDTPSKGLFNVKRAEKTSKKDDDLFGDIPTPSSKGLFDGSDAKPAKRTGKVDDDLFGDKPTPKSNPPPPLSDDLFAVKNKPSKKQTPTTEIDEEDLFASLDTVPKQTKTTKPVNPVKQVTEDLFATEGTKPIPVPASKGDNDGLFSDAPDLNAAEQEKKKDDKDDLFASTPAGKKPLDTTVSVVHVHLVSMCMNLNMHTFNYVQC